MRGDEEEEEAETEEEQEDREEESQRGFQGGGQGQYVPQDTWEYRARAGAGEERMRRHEQR